MSAKYWQRGETIDYTPTDDLANGDVVDLATRIGVAGNDIPAGETGAVHVVGVFEIPKATGAVTVGQALYWDKAAENITTAAGSSPANTPAGWAVVVVLAGSVIPMDLIRKGILALLHPRAQEPEEKI